MTCKLDFNEIFVFSVCAYTMIYLPCPPAMLHMNFPFFDGYVHPSYLDVIALSIEDNGGQAMKSEEELEAQRIEWAKKDTLRYRQGYPDLDKQTDDTSKNKNLLFYQGKIPSAPSGDLIDVIHDKWWGDYKKLERHHSYIQWLFPLRERPGFAALQQFMPHEIKAMKADAKIMRRIRVSYDMMLHFKDNSKCNFKHVKQAPFFY
jgi:hypothetical protein